MRVKKIDSIKNENKAIKLRRDEIEKEIKKLQDFIKNQEENINKKMENLIDNIKEK